MPLTLFPAIDLKDGACVRLQRGEMDRATVFGTDPGAQAAAWAAAGFTWLHVVDLNGAFAGESRNGPAVHEILRAVKIPVQLGGGIRDLAGIEAWLEAGISRVILGSAAAKNPALVLAACKRFPAKIVVGIDAKNGFVATEGWAEISAMRASDLAARLADAGVAAIIYTDIARDGMKTGLNLAETTALAAQTRIPVIASGGLKNLEDLLALKSASLAQTNLTGAILGRALYDGSLNPAQALAAC